MIGFVAQDLAHVTSKALTMIKNHLFNLDKITPGAYIEFVHTNERLLLVAKYRSEEDWTYVFISSFDGQFQIVPLDIIRQWDIKHVH